MPVVDNGVDEVSSKPKTFGLSCGPTGLDLAGVPLLRRDGARFEPRPPAEIDYLLERAYRAEGKGSAVGDTLEAVAYALNCGKTAAATALARTLRLPRLDWDGAVRIAYADTALRKAYNPNEPRDWHGRWTSGAGSQGTSVTQSSSSGLPLPPPSRSPRWLQLASNDATMASGAPILSPPAEPESVKLLPSDWVSLPQGDGRIDEVADLLEWIANAKPEEALDIRKEIKRKYYDVGDSFGGDMLNISLGDAIQSDVTREQRQEILETLDHLSRRDPVAAGGINDMVRMLALPELLRTPRQLRAPNLSGAAPTIASKVVRSAFWDWSIYERGEVVEELLGPRNLVSNFPVIDRFYNGIATSIKSLDLTAATYQNEKLLFNRLNKFVNALVKFKGASWGEDVVEESDILGRELSIGIPEGSMTEKQMIVFTKITRIAEKLGVKIIITEL